WAVQVHWQKENRVVPVLIPIRLRLHEQHLLGEPVRRVGLLGIAVPQIVFLERHGRELRIGADGPNRNEFRHAGFPRFMEQVRAHHQVVVKELTGPLAVGADSADDGSQVNDEGRLRVAIHADYVSVFAEVVITVRWSENRGALLFSKLPHDVTAQKAAATGDQYSLWMPETHTRRTR